jgi:hypothetical protein
MTVVFELDRQKFTALNGGPIFKFAEFTPKLREQEERIRAEAEKLKNS